MDWYVQFDSISAVMSEDFSVSMRSNIEVKRPLYFVRKSSWILCWLKIWELYNPMPPDKLTYRVPCSLRTISRMRSCALSSAGMFRSLECIHWVFRFNREQVACNTLVTNSKGVPFRVANVVHNSGSVFRCWNGLSLSVQRCCACCLNPNYP